MHSYILQIEGTTDANFDINVVIIDALFGFALHAEKYASESYENIREHPY